MKLSLLIITLLSCAVQESATLEPKAFQKKAAETKDAVILDVRTKGEIDQGIIPGAKNIDYKGDNFEEQIGKLDKNKTYFVYCKAGGRSSKTIDIMKSLGFTKLYELDGGMDAWK